MPSKKELRGGLTLWESRKPLPDNHWRFRGGYVVGGTYTRGRSKGTAVQNSKPESKKPNEKSDTIDRPVAEESFPDFF